MNDIHKTTQVLVLLLMFSCVCLSSSDVDSIFSCIYEQAIGVSVAKCGDEFNITYWDSPLLDYSNITFTCTRKEHIKIPLDTFKYLQPLTDFTSFKIVIENCNINEDFINQFKMALISLPNLDKIEGFEISLNANDQNTSLSFQNKSLLTYCPCHLFSVSYQNINGLQAGVIPDCVRGLSVTNSNLQTLPRDIFSSNGILVNIRMEHNKFIHLPDFIFQNLTNVEYLSLAGNKLSVLGSNIFTGLQSLRKLKLSFNNITTLSADIFKPLVLLSTLKLDNNPMIKVSESSFASLHNLKYLFLSSCVLRSYNTSIFNNYNYSGLDISNNSISGLENLNLQHPYQELYLSNNNISSTDNFSHYVITSELQSLQMRNCGLRYISADFLQEATKIKTLDLGENYIRVLPENFLQNSKLLNKVYFDYNEIAEISDSIFRDKVHLNDLSLSNNLLTKIGTGILNNLTNLVSLNLSHNQISKVHRKAFEDTFLHELDLSYNMLTTTNSDVIFIRPNSFDLDLNWRKMRKLNLSHNNITICVIISDSESSLEELLLNDNELTQWSSTRLLSLVTLDLANNQLDPSSFYSYFETTPYLQSINLSNNGWKTLYKTFQISKYLQRMDMSLNDIQILFPRDFLYSSQTLNIEMSNNDVATIVLEDRAIKEDIGYQDTCSDVYLKITTNKMNCDCYMINALRFYENDITLRRRSDVYVANISESQLMCERPAVLQGGSFEDIESWSLGLISVVGLCLL